MATGGGNAITDIPTIYKPYITEMMEGGSTVGTGVLSALNTAITEGSPWLGITAFDPTSDLAALFSTYDAFDAEANNISPASQWGAYADAAVAKASTVVMGAADIDTAVAAFDTKGDLALLQAYNALSASAQSNNGVEGSGMFSGFAALHASKILATQSERSRLNQQKNSAVVAFVSDGVGQMENAQARRLDALRTSLTVRTQITITRINSNREWINDKVEIAVNHRQYFLKLYPFAGNILATALGAPNVPVGPSKMSTALSAAFSDAATGVAIGSKGGVGGAVAGGVLGSILGLASGAL